MQNSLPVIIYPYIQIEVIASILHTSYIIVQVLQFQFPYINYYVKQRVLS